MSGLTYQLGFIFRETGRALDSLGCRLQGNKAYMEELWRHKSLQNLGTTRPTVGSGAFIAPSATLCGRVDIGEKANIWYGAVLRGDAGPISVGKNSNLQDGVIVRTMRASPRGSRCGSSIGDNVTVGHSAVLNGVTIEDEAFIGIGAVLQEGVTVEKGAMVAAGAVVAPGSTVPKGEVWGGNPAKFLRSIKPEESSFIVPSAAKYVDLAEQHKVAA